MDYSFNPHQGQRTLSADINCNWEKILPVLNLFLDRNHTHIATLGGSLFFYMNEVISGAKTLCEENFDCKSITNIREHFGCIQLVMNLLDVINS